MFVCYLPNLNVSPTGVTSHIKTISSIIKNIRYLDITTLDIFLGYTPMLE